MFSRDFPSGPVVKNQPANAGAWIGPLVQKDPTYQEQLSLYVTTTEASPRRARAPQQEKPPQCAAGTPQ